MAKDKMNRLDELVWEQETGILTADGNSELNELWIEFFNTREEE